MNCPHCQDNDLSLVSYVEIEQGCYEVRFQCRQCGNEFTVEMFEDELNQYR